MLVQPLIHPGSPDRGRGRAEPENSARTFFGGGDADFSPHEVSWFYSCGLGWLELERDGWLWGCNNSGLRIQRPSELPGPRKYVNKNNQNLLKNSSKSHYGSHFWVPGMHFGLACSSGLAPFKFK